MPLSKTAMGQRGTLPQYGDVKDFWLGCNYWASHAGTAMWSDWRPEVVESDLDRLAGIGTDTLRVFPLWPDFQPLHLLREWRGHAKEYRFGETPLPETEEGRNGVSSVMLDRFGILADLAHARGMRLLPGLVTGWMSGRLFVPPALEGKNIVTDPEAVMWQGRFVRTFVRRFRDHPAIAAWDLGNECNCLGDAGSREAAWQWTACIAGAIRSEDPARPVISGMHSLHATPVLGPASRTHPWTIEDQGELTDILTVHPYPLFTPHCDRDPIDTVRSGLHATAEGVLYADIGGKPCLAEEVGTLGPSIASDETAGRYLRSLLYSLWSHGNRGMLWWCAADQRHLEGAPYDWCALERELGLIRADGSAKPVAHEIASFAAFLKEAPPLPERLREAVCILGEGQDAWGAAFASFILAKQAGFDLVFQNTGQPLREAPLYLLPSITTQPKRRFDLALLEKVRAGATLYVSIDSPWLSDLRELFGVEVQTRCQRTGPASLVWGKETFSIGSGHRLDIIPKEAEVLATEPDGNPAFTRMPCGKGTIYFLSVPLETWLIQQPGVFHKADAPPWRRFYEEISAGVRAGRVLKTEALQVGITEHPRDDRFRYAVAVNYGPEPVRLPLRPKTGWKVGPILRGTVDGGSLLLPANDAAVLTLENPL